MSKAQENAFGPRRSTMKMFGCSSRAGSVFRRCDGFVALRLRCELVFICPCISQASPGCSAVVVEGYAFLAMDS